MKLLRGLFSSLNVPGTVFGPVAVANYTGTAWVKDLHGSAPGDEGASAKNGPTRGFRHELLTTTVDAYAARMGLRHIHMLAIDAEGWDPLIIEGSHGLLAAKRVDFLEFEFSTKSKWSGLARDQRFLRDTLAGLHRVGYTCYWTGGDKGIEGRLAVANGDQWCESFGAPMWSNLACTHLPWAIQALSLLT